MTDSKLIQHIAAIDSLRGVAALSVCALHFSDDFLPETNLIGTIASFGGLGVQVFFVISGFLIPYSLYARRYTLGECWSFLCRRLKRLEPPYFACIALVIALNYLSSLSPGFRGKPSEVNLPQLLGHIAYLNSILHLGWLIDPFWTLAIEFQFYVFIALAFPLITHSSQPLRVTSVAVIAAAGVVFHGHSSLLTCWLPLFSIGIVTFQFLTGLLSTKLFIVLGFGTACGCFFTLGSLQTTAGLLTAAAILIFRSTPSGRFLRPIAFVGTISYSLYLIHVPIGGRIINLARRLPATKEYQYSAIAAALVISVAFAWLFWWLVERPSQRWAKGQK
jgi:peptidoglycan/LPS O-acetylase OafA/YrhL